jgi:hypothetical protein
MAPEPDYSDPRVLKAIRKAQRPWYQKKRFLIPLVLVALVLVTSALSSGDDTAPPPTAGGPAPVAPPARTDDDPDFVATTYGQTADSSGLQLTATAPKPVTEIGSSYYCTTVTYVNNTGDQASFNAFDWKMTDTEGVEVDTTIGGTRNYLGSGELRPGGRKSGDVCFSKQGDGTPQGITYRGGLFGTPVQWQKQ